MLSHQLTSSVMGQRAHGRDIYERMNSNEVAMDSNDARIENVWLSSSGSSCELALFLSMCVCVIQHRLTDNISIACVAAAACLFTVYKVGSARSFCNITTGRVRRAVLCIHASLCLVVKPVEPAVPCTARNGLFSDCYVLLSKAKASVRHHNLATYDRKLEVMYSSDSQNKGVWVSEDFRFNFSFMFRGAIMTGAGPDALIGT